MDDAVCVGQQRRGNEHGFTYIMVLSFIAIMGIWLVAASEVWHIAMKREKEEELLFAGAQIRDAIAMYSSQMAGAGGYPASLEDLLKDPRYPGTRRYLRKIYLDPITNSADWGLVVGANGEILGVHSSSEEEPLKKNNFNLADQDFEGKMKYSDWVFTISAKNVPATSLKPPPGALDPPINP